MLPSMAKLGNLPFFRHFTLISFVSVLILNFSVLEFGFDNSVFGLIQAMDGRLAHSPGGEGGPESTNI